MENFNQFSGAGEREMNDFDHEFAADEAETSSRRRQLLAAVQRHNSGLRGHTNSAVDTSNHSVHGPHNQLSSSAVNSNNRFPYAFQNAQRFVESQNVLQGSHYHSVGATFNSTSHNSAGGISSFHTSSRFARNQHESLSAANNASLADSAYNIPAVGAIGEYIPHMQQQSAHDPLPAQSSHRPNDSEQEQVEEDEEEEEDAAEDEGIEISGPASQAWRQASSRQSRSRWWPRRSDPHPVYRCIYRHRREVGNNIIGLGTGEDSGRNRMAIFQNAGNVPRLAYNIRLTGRGNAHWEGYASPQDVYLPVGTSLDDMLAIAPNHAWNDGLRLFMAEGWSAERMWNGFPIDARNAGASSRQWNYLQQALGREADKIAREVTGVRRIPVKRRKREQVQESDGEDQ